MTPFIDQDDLGALLHEDLEDDQLAVDACAAACDEVRSYTGQTLTFVANDVLLLDAPASSLVLLPQLPVVSVMSVVLSGTELTVDTDYTVIYSLGALLRTNAENWGNRWTSRYALQVTYDHGYLLEEDSGTAEVVPEDLKFVAAQIAARKYRSDRSGDVVKMTTGNYSEELGSMQSFQEDERRVLDTYRFRAVV